MSAFLGPVHYWLYHKITWHENLLEAIYGIMASKGVETQLIKHYTEHQYGAPERSELSEVIDGGNIHGWLQTKIQSLEYRMAYVITYALSNGQLTLDELKTLYHADGVKAYEQYSGQIESPQEMYKAIYDYLLEGMPCDRVNQPLSVDEDSMSWVKKMCIHTEFWKSVKGDIMVFDQLRVQWLNGFVDDRFELQISDDNEYRILRRTA